MKKRKLYNIAFMGDKDHGCDIISTLESWGGSSYYTRTGSDPEYVYFINNLGSIDFIHNSEMLSKEMKNFYFLFWHDYNIECQLKVGESVNYGGQDYDVDSILFDANNRCIVYKLKSFGIGVEYITNNELIPTEEYQSEEENNEYLCKNNIKRKLAIRGHATRGKEVIELLEMLGAKNNCASTGYNLGLCYLIDDEFDICAHYFGYDDYEDGGLNIFTLEEFLERYPFKVGDKVFDTADGDPGTIAAMKWDEDVSDMKYHVAFDNGDMGWYTNDTIKFLKKDKNLEDRKTMNKKLAIKGHPTRGEEVIELLEMMSGYNIHNLYGDDNYAYYVIEGCQNEIRAGEYIFGDEDMYFFTLEEFLDKYPFRIGDAVIYTKFGDDCNDYPLIIKSMKWTGTTMEYEFDGYFTCLVKDLKMWKSKDNHTNVSEMKSVLAELLEHIKTTPKEELEREFEEIKEWSNVGPTVDEFRTFCECVNKKPTYPKTYVDSCEVLGYTVNDVIFTNDTGWIRITNKLWDCYAEEHVYEGIGIINEHEYKDIRHHNVTGKMELGQLKHCKDVDDVRHVNSITDDIMINQITNKVSVIKFKPDVCDNKIELQLDDYEIEVRDGKTYAVKKKPKYPDNYEECVRIAKNIHGYDIHIDAPAYRELMESFVKLLICRDAYWKIAGEQMGLGKPWKPDWTSDKPFYCISVSGNIIGKGKWYTDNKILAFPTEEMRDAFYENFKDLIEQCKELL